MKRTSAITKNIGLKDMLKESGMQESLLLCVRRRRGMYSCAEGTKGQNREFTSTSAILPK